VAGEAFTIDANKVSAAAGNAVGKMAESVAGPLLNNLQSAKDIGIGGSWIEDLIKWIQGFFSKIGDFFSSIFKSIFGGSSPPAAPSAPAAPAPSPERATAEVPSPGRTPPALAPDRGRNGGRTQ